MATITRRSAPAPRINILRLRLCSSSDGSMGVLRGRADPVSAARYAFQCGRHRPSSSQSNGSPSISVTVPRRRASANPVQLERLGAHLSAFATDVSASRTIGATEQRRLSSRNERECSSSWHHVRADKPGTSQQ